MSCTVFGDKNFKKHLERSVSRQYMIKTNIQEFPQGIIVNEQKHGFGVFDKDFRFVKSSRQVRKNNSQLIPRFNHKDIPYVDEDVIFIGNVYPAFGHFLLEHMNRAYVLLNKKYKKLKVVLINNKGVNPVPNYMFELLELLGVNRNDILILNETTRFKKVVVPSQGFNIPVYSSTDFGKTFDVMADAVKDIPDVAEKIYVSRGALKSRRTFGEVVVQKIFEKNGFKIIYPETLPLKQQISYARNCKVLAGIAGTALHLALFMRSGGTVIQIKRNRLPKCNADVQYLIDSTKELDTVFVSGSVEEKPTEHYSSVPQIIGVNKYMRVFFDVYNFKLTEQEAKADKKDMAEYNAALDEYNKRYSGVWLNALKHKIVHYSACLIPGRERRGRWRNWLKKKLNAEG